MLYYHYLSATWAEERPSEGAEVKAALERRMGDQGDGGQLITPPGIDDDFDEGYSWDVLTTSQGLTPPIEVPCSSDCNLQLPAVHNFEETKSLRASGDTIPPLTRADLDQLYFDRTHSFVPIIQQDTIQRAWTSSGRAIRLVQLMKLNRIDDIDANLGAGFEVHPNILVEKEEKRRTFWMVFCLDRFSCALDGLPLTLMSNCAFRSGIPMVMSFLLDVMTGDDTNILSPFVECIIFSAWWGCGLAHQHHATVEHIYGDVSSEFLQRQLTLDDTLSCRLQQLQQNYPQASINASSVLLFTIMMVQVTILSLCSVAESISSSVEGSTVYQSRFGNRLEVDIPGIELPDLWLSFPNNMDTE
ncbi:hypothetical protein DL770_005338 [Monosporascus sp. CRB-9-2]|nr:hypothetical protein DL770_005338 [Monosporascus sp. CRB-9-2]